jgi:hypothetical protein
LFFVAEPGRCRFRPASPFNRHPAEAGIIQIVIPAEAGIHFAFALFPSAKRNNKVKMDPGLRRDDDGRNR